ncbi:MAG: GntR family transcriptional regulator [Alphaproteobacteria bacterium]|nr:GntR family transcriptional regulator [Alphaproteobacteria bacterium]
MTDLKELIEQARPRYRTATAFVAETLRSAILKGALDEGAALRQDDLAATFGVSRMPIREALRQLEAEGLVDFQPHKGAIVALLPRDEIWEVYEMRVMAETFALRLSLPHLTVVMLDRAAALLEEAEGEPDVTRWGILNRQFHLTLLSGAPRKRLTALIDQLHNAVDRYLRFLLANLDYEQRSQEEHRVILAACRAGDVDGAVEALRQHLTGGGRAMVEFVEHREAGKKLRW